MEGVTWEGEGQVSDFMEGGEAGSLPRISSYALALLAEAEKQLCIPIIDPLPSVQKVPPLPPFCGLSARPRAHRACACMAAKRIPSACMCIFGCVCVWGGGVW